MEKIISNAIKNQILLKINYKGTTRIIEPHAFGLDKKGVLKLRAYQIEGDSKSKNPKAWKLFKVDNIQKISELNENFQVRPDYNHSGDSAIPKIITKI